MSKPTIVTKSAPLVLFAVAVIALSFALWRQQAELARIRQENAYLKEESPAAEEKNHNERMARVAHKASAQARSHTPSEAPVSTDAAPANDSPRIAPSNDRLEMTPTGLAVPAPGASGLTLAGTHVTPVPDGLRATMRFFPDPDEPPGIVAVVVRLPPGGDSRILNLEVAGEMEFANVAKRVSEDGKFAVFHATAQNAEVMEVGLSVSGAAVADVRGTAGIGPFDLDISPLEATATPK